MPESFELWRIKTVCQKTGLSERTVFRAIDNGTFPAARRLGPAMVAWRSDEVLAWMEARPRATVPTPPPAPPSPPAKPPAARRARA